MSKLSFKNFRGFIDFPEMEIGGVTFLVGKNNSGKSSAIKAMQLILEYLISNNLFALNLNGYDVFDNLKNRESKDDFITFKYEENDFIYELTIYERTYNLSQNRIRLKIEDIQNGFTFYINDEECEDPRESIYHPYIYFFSKKAKLKGKLHFDIISHLKYINCSMLGLMYYIQRKLLKIYFRHTEDGNCQYDMQEKIDIEIWGIKLYNFPKRIRYESKDLDEKSIKEDMTIIRSIIISIDKFIGIYNDPNYPQFQLIKSQINMKYNVLIGSDYGFGFVVSYFHEKNIGQQLMNRGIHLTSCDINGDPKPSKEIKDEDRTKAFILKWMSVDYFNLGEDFEIEKVGDDSYSVFIIINEQRVPISEMGLGAIRIIYTLISLTIALYLSNFDSGNKGKWLFVFEEPELNLHPAWQSKLADLFYEVNKISKNNVQIILETHSEYIIRRSQVLVAENKLETIPNQNPFKIYYFNDEGDKKHYQIKYEEDGFLKNGFGSGFFDEASSNTLELMRLKKVKLN